jgi:hypothetical protein
MLSLKLFRIIRAGLLLVADLPAESLFHRLLTKVPWWLDLGFAIAGLVLGWFFRRKLRWFLRRKKPTPTAVSSRMPRRAAPRVELPKGGELQNIVEIVVIQESNKSDGGQVPPAAVLNVVVHQDGANSGPSRSGGALSSSPTPCQPPFPKKKTSMCDCLNGTSFRDAVAGGRVLSVHYHLDPEEIEIFVICKHGWIIPFTAYAGTEEFAEIYEAVWKEKMERAKDSL